MRKPFARRWLAALLTLALMLSLSPAVFAVDPPTTNPPAATVDLTGIKLDRTTLSLIEGGNEETLKVLDKDGNDLPASAGTVTWRSVTESVATVKDGVVKPLTDGTTTIEATVTPATGEAKTLRCVVTVAAATISSIKVTLRETAISVAFGGDNWINIEKVEATLSNGTLMDLSGRTNLTWSVRCGDSSLELPTSGKGLTPIRVHASKIPAANPVSVTVTVSYDGVTSESATCAVTVNSKNRVVITEYNVPISDLGTTLNATEGVQKVLGAFVTENDTIVNNPTITWTSSASDIVEVTGHSDGTVTLNPKKTGRATITATSGAATASVVCVVSAAPIVDPDNPDNPDNPGTGDKLPDNVSVSEIRFSAPTSPHVMDPGTENVTLAVSFAVKGPNGGETFQDGKVEWTRGGSATVTYTEGRQKYILPISCASSDRSVVSISGGRITASKTGNATITASVGGKSAKLEVTVSGFTVEKESVTIIENRSVDPIANGIVALHGDFKATSLSFWSDSSAIATYENGKIVARAPGTTTFTVTDGSRRATFTVKVDPDPNATIEAGSIKVTDTLKFSKLLSKFRLQAGGNLSHITGLNLDPNQGTLYYKYKSANEPGVGVGAGSYYLASSTGQPLISDITFVPKASYTGEVTISYTAVAGNQNYNCYIRITVEPDGSSSAGTKGINLTTKYNTPVKFSSTEFNKVCRDKTGVNLSYVTFSQPPERQGTLYTNYTSSGSYGGVVDMRRQYTLKQLDDIWFVPAPGYVGSVTVYYTAYSTSASGESYTGQVNITVGRESGSEMGGLHYEIFQGGAVHFDDLDFNDYCRDLLDDYQMLSLIRFTSLPAASEGVLYYDYRSTSSTGSSVSTDTNYYYGTLNPRIDRLTFVAAKGYTGTVRIPFTGYTTDGTRFTGNVEINVRAGGNAGAGDIQYTCAPGRSVSFNDNHFNSLCQDVTGRSLNYIIFQSLPSSVDGTLYHGSGRASTSTRYYNGSGASKIDNLSFRAANSFAGVVNIPFIGYANSGDTFRGVVTVESNSSGTSTNRGNIRYSTGARTAVVFDRDDFDDLSQWETDRNVSSVRFQVPSSSQGSLYSGYRSSSNQGTRITRTTTINASDLDRVAFIPASGFSGTAYVDFTVTPTGSGASFTGTVEIEVGYGTSSSGTVRYSTRTTPVNFQSNDFGNGSIQLTSLPSASAGFLYYQYISPAHYGEHANIGINYTASSLTFVPKAGYTGTASIGYTGFNSNGSTFQGEVLITISPSYSSAYFSDMSGYSDTQRAAVDFLRENGITNGISGTQYGPEYSITRGDFAVMIYQAFGMTASGSAGSFNDVPSGIYYAQAVNTLRALGVVSGVGNGAYAPRGTVSRQDAVCMVQRAMRACGWNANDGYAGILSSYSDGGSVAGYAQGAVANAVQTGWLPTRNGRLDPRGALTRVDMAEMIHRVLTY